MRKVRKGVITAAGRGTRQYPATSVVQKAMLPLVDRDGVTKPTIQIIAEEAFAAGVEQICIVISPGDAEQFETHFHALERDLLPSFKGKQWALLESDKLARMRAALHFAVQETPEGYGHAVFQAREFVGAEPFLLLLGDHIYVSYRPECCVEQLVGAYERSDANAVSAVKRTGIGDLHRFGTAQGEPVAAGGGRYRVTALREKPDRSYATANLVTPGLPPDQFLCFFGMHVLPPVLFDCLEENIARDLRENGEIQLTSALETMRRRIPEYHCFEVSGDRYDTGIPFGLMEAQLALALSGIHRHEIVESLARLLTHQLANKQT